MRIFSAFRAWFGRLLRRRPAPYGLVYFEGDELPDTLAPRTLVVAHEDGVEWMAGMQCPCGCGRRIELMLLKDVKPRWSVSVDERGHPSLHPSVWAQSGCRSHFWLRDGAIEWCRDD